MEAKKTYFSKDDTSVMKGIAILLMMLHHCFMSADRFTGYRIRFLPFGKARVMRVAAYSKICVAIFVFLSAYGLTFIIKKMWNSDSFKFKDIRKFYINRYISLISGYFVIVIGSLVIAQLIDGRTYESFFKGKSTFVGIRNIILNILGIQEWFDLSDFCGTWWYMSLAVIIILLLPLFYYLVKKTRWNYLVITAVLMFATRLVCYKRFVKFIKIFSSKHAYQNMTNWLVIVLIGMLFADEDIFGKIKTCNLLKGSIAKRVILFFIETGILLFSIYIYRYLSSDKYYAEVKFAIIPLIFICYCYLNIINIKWLRQILGYCGVHSANIFMVHTFIRVYYMNGLVYSCGTVHFILTIAVLFGYSLAISIVLESFKERINYNDFIKKLRVN